MDGLNSRLEIAKGRAGECKQRSIKKEKDGNNNNNNNIKKRQKTRTNKTQTIKKQNKTQQPSDLWENIKQSNMHVIEVTEGKRK